MKTHYSIIKTEQNIQTVTRQEYYVRLCLFVLLEGAFLVLAAFCLEKPIFVDLGFSFTDSRSFFAALFIVWNFLATLVLDKVIGHCLASEWHHLLETSGKLVAGSTDKVSTLTSGILARLQHAVTSEASSAFKLAVAAQLAILGIQAVVPGAVILTTVPRDEVTPFDVANFSIHDSGGSRGLEIFQRRAYLISRAEIREGSLYGYKMAPNAMIPWPVVNLSSAETAVQYPTDLIQYSYQCRWELPTFAPSSPIGITGRNWTTDVGYSDSSGASFYRAVSQMHETYSVDKNPNYTDGVTAFLFFGHNQTYQSGISSPTNKPPGVLNFENIPATYNASGYTFSSNVSNITIYEPLASALICDPHYQLTGGKAVLHSDGSLDIAQAGLSRVGNIALDDALWMFQRGFLDIFEDPDVVSNDDHSSLNFAGAHTFLMDSSLNLDSITSEDGLRVLPLPDIERNMNALMSSVSKAMCSGLTRSQIRDELGRYWQPTTSVMAQKLVTTKALVTNRIFFWIGIGLFLVAVCSMGALDWVVRWEGMEPLGLASIMRALDEGDDEDTHRFKVIHNQEPGQTVTHREFLIRMSSFFILEGGFIAFAGYSLQPMFVDFPLAVNDAHPLFTAVFISWTFLSFLALIKLIEHVFASEWQYLLRSSGSLVTGTTDKVSTLTSGMLERLSLVTSARASRAFRFTFAAHLVLLVIKSIVPGTVTLASVPRDQTSPMKVANFSRIAGMGDKNTSLIQDRANLISRLEFREGRRFGLNVNNNTVVGWPVFTLSEGEVSARYPTDVMDFAYECHREMPVFTQLTPTAILNVGGREWSVDVSRRIISPMYETNPSGDGISAYLLLGYNTTHYTPRRIYNYTWYGVLNVEDAPAAYQSGGWNFSSGPSGALTYTAPLASVVICDPHFQITGGEALLLPNSKLDVVKRGLEQIGNIAAMDAAFMFRQGAEDAFKEQDLIDDGYISFAAAYVFTNDSSLSRTPIVNGTGLHVAPMADVERRMGEMMSSLAKAYSAGLAQSPESEGIYVQSMMTVVGSKQVLTTAFTSSLPLFCISAGLFVVVLVLAGFGGRVARWEDMEPFDLGSVMKVLDREEYEPMYQEKKTQW